VAHEGCNPRRVGTPARREVLSVAGSSRRPAFVQPVFPGMGGLGEECADDARRDALCSEAINPRHATGTPISFAGI
jgi:hypothetical protein